MKGEEIPPNEQFMEGSIFRVRVHHFMTYTDAEFYPGPRLNLILGANGTGKSTIVCALSLGLAGNPKSCGRAEEVGSYVQHEKLDGFVEIELYFAKGNMIIQRSIRREGNYSSWQLNGGKSNQKAIKELMMHHSIQIDNLCQFLPQDKVSEFSEMNAQKLLLETQRAHKDGNLHTIHENIIKWQKQHEVSLRDVELARDELNKVTLENDLRSREVDRLQEHQDRMDQTELLEKKILWAKVKLKEEELEDATAGKDAIKTEYATLQQAFEPADQERQIAEDKMNVLKESQSTAKDQKVGADAAFGKQKEKIESFDRKQEDIMQELNAIRTNRQTLERKVARKEKKIADTKSTLSGASNVEELKQRRSELISKARMIDSQLADSAQEIDNVKGELLSMTRDQDAVKARMNHMNNVLEDKIRRITQNNPHVQKALQYIQSNRHLFRRTVSGPLAREITLLDQADANAVESGLGKSILMAFVTECKEDYDTLMSAMDTTRTKISVYNVQNGVCKSVETSAGTYSPAVMKDLSSQFGIRGTLVQLIQAPDVIMEVLCANGAAASTLIGSSRTEKAIMRSVDAVIQACLNHRPMLRLISPNSTYNSKVSKYGNRATVTTPGVVHPAKFLGGNISADDATALDELKRQSQDLEDKIKASRQSMDALRKEKGPHTSQLHELQREESDVARNITEILRAQRVLLQLEDELLDYQQQLAQDVSTEEASIFSKLKNIQKSQAKEVFKLSSKLSTTWRLQQTHGISTLQATSAKIINSVYAKHVDRLDKKLVATMESYQHLKTSLKRMKNEKILLEKNAQQSAPLKDYGVVFSTLPDDHADICAMIANNRATTEHFHGNLEVLDIFNETKLMIVKLQQEFDDKTDEYSKTVSDLQQTKGPWHESLKIFVQSINESFSEYFKAMGCVGQVELDDKDEDVSKWGIIRQAQFREGVGLKTMNAEEQSGGEKSVGTIMYMMALQSLTHCPFRVVDEINQGMDEANERKVFDRITSTSCGTKLPQYFLITPKLITNLHYHDDVKVMVILNGRGSISQREWDVEDFCNAQRMCDDRSASSQSKRPRLTVSS